MAAVPDLVAESEFDRNGDRSAAVGSAIGK